MTTSHPPSRSHIPSPTTESFDLLTPDGHPLGHSKLRSHVHRDGDWHRAVHIWVVHEGRGEVLIQLRAKCKDSFPGCWDVGCAGHLSAGETSEEAAVAELEEEVGLTVSGAVGAGVGGEGVLAYLTTLKREVISQQGAFVDREFVDVYYTLTDKEASDMRLQAEEVEAVRYIDIDEYVRTLEAREEGYVPYPDLPTYRREVFDRLKQIIAAPHNSE